MNYVLLAIVTICCSVQQIFKKAYNVKKVGNVFVFSAASAFTAMIFFVISSKGVFTILPPKVLPYSICFAMAYCLSTTTSMIAIKLGPLSISSLITSYSLIIPTFYGFIILEEPLKLWLMFGIILLLISLFFINREKQGEEKKITFKWCIFAFLSFIGNGMLSIIQKAHQTEFDGMYKNEFMIIALLITSLVLVIIAIIYDREKAFTGLKKGFWLYTGCGVANGIVNLLVLILSGKMPASVMFPVISAGGVLMAAFVSVFIYKEFLSKTQWLGLMIGTVSIVLLNI